MCLLAVLALSACQGEDLGPGPEPGSPALVTVQTGDGQEGPAGQALAAPIVARVTDAQGREVAGVAVAFEAGAGSGTLAPAAPRTDDRGQARAIWTLGTGVGPMSATISISGLEPVRVTATSRPGAPARLGFQSVPEAAVAGAPIEPPVAVEIQDEYGNRVPGATVQVVLALDHGELGGQTTKVAVDGVATFADLHIDTADPAYVLTATAEGLALAESGTFAVASGVAAELIRTAGDGQSAEAGKPVPVAPAVVVRDAAGNPVAGVRVDFEVSEGGGSVSPAAVVTDTDGTAAVEAWSLGPAAGANVLQATAPALPDRTVTFEAEGVPGPVATIVVMPEQAALLVDQTLALEAEALDENGNPVSDAAVSWSSSDPDIASVSGAGIVTAIAPGSVTITATSDGRSGAAELSVSLNEGTLTNVTYCTMDGVAVRMDVYIPDASKPRPLPVAIHVHGGGWVSGRKSTGTRFAEVSSVLLERGYLVASLDYRLGPTHKYPAQIQDVKCAVRHLRARAGRYGLDPDRIGAWGGSAGGQLVSLLGTADASVGFDDAGGFPGESSEVQAVVAISPITDFTHPEELNDDYSRAFQTWPDPTSPEMIEASPVTHVSGADAPFFLIAGEDDALVLPAQSERLHQRLLGAGVPSTLLVVENADHDLLPTDGPIDPPSAVINSRLADFFDQHLR